MTLTKNIKKFELPSPHPQPRFWFDSKKHVHNNYGSHVYNKTDVTLRVFLYIMAGAYTAWDTLFLCNFENKFVQFPK